MTEKQLIIQRYFKQYYKDNKSKIKAANRNRYFKDHENRKAYGRAQQKVYYQNEKEKLIKEVVDRVRVKFFDEEFVPEDEERVKKSRRSKPKKLKNPNRVPYGYWQEQFPKENFKNAVDRQRAIWAAQMKAKGKRGYYRSEKCRAAKRAYKEKMLRPIQSIGF